jgi:hypothetical protein
MLAEARPLSHQRAIQLTNTGNIGTVDRVTITWPQQGYSPLAMNKRIHLTVCATRDIQFHMP